jgi:hypothetical protein
MNQNCFQIGFYSLEGLDALTSKVYYPLFEDTNSDILILILADTHNQLPVFKWIFFDKRGVLIIIVNFQSEIFITIHTTSLVLKLI